MFQKINKQRIVSAALSEAKKGKKKDYSHGAVALAHKRMVL